MHQIVEFCSGELGRFRCDRASRVECFAVREDCTGAEVTCIC